MIKYKEPYDAVQFELIDPGDFKPAFDKAIQKTKTEISRIKNNAEEPTFKNTVEALEQSTYDLKRLEHLLFNLNLAETNASMQSVARDISPLLTDFQNDITLDPLLFDKIKHVMEKHADLSTEQKQLLRETYKSFIRNGSGLSGDDREKFRDITRELSILSLRFSENVLNATNSYRMRIEDEDDLSGLPAHIIEAAAHEAQSLREKGWIFTLKAPVYLAFMKFADHRKLREKMFLAYNSRCFQGDEMDNRQIVLQIVKLRQQLADLLGHPNYAAYVLEERMAGNPGKVNRFLNDLLEASKPFALRDFNEVRKFAGGKDPLLKLMPWDWAYFSEKLRQEKFILTDEMTKPYFELNRVLQGVFRLAGRLYGIDFLPDDSIPAYHPDVKTYRVHDTDGKFISLLYMDFFPRKGKQGGAWMTNYREQYRQNGNDLRPQVSLVFNFTPPSGNKPALLTYDELRTLLHEFGHGLHGMLSECIYGSLSGTNVYLDFVELPSQIMENWAEEKEWLNEIAIHYETGEKIPGALLENIIRARNFNNGYAFIRQLGFALNDMAWHTQIMNQDIVVAEFEEKAMAPASLFPKVEGTNFSTIFNHIFGGGYAAGYYGYKWAEVLDADAFSLFKEKGIFDRATAESFRENILSRGGTEDPMILYKRFRGREPSLEPLLERSGLK